MNKQKSAKALNLMLKSRFFEEKTEELFKSGLIHGTTHLANGQEAVQAGLCISLDENDWIVPTHRCHGFTICKGSDPYKMFSEMFGSVYGLAKGLGGSMHMPDSEHCNLGSSAVVGSGVPLATGIAFSIKAKAHGNTGFAVSSDSNPKLKPKVPVKNVSVAIFGDGATSRGSIHESMNIASIWKLPVLFLCENNHYGMSASSDVMISTDCLSSRAKAYSMEGATVDGNDVEAVTNAVEKALLYIKEGNGPYFLECLTYRFKGHSKSDRRLYRTQEEENSWLNRDPITLFERKLITENLFTKEEIEQIEEICRREIENAATKALADSKNTISKDTMLSLVYASMEERK